MYSPSCKDYLGKTHDPEQLRQMARACFCGPEDSDAWAKGKMYLLIAARMGDRGASWLLALYYRGGCYNFERDFQKSEYWRVRTEQQLRHDASQVYDDEALKKLAKYRYDHWKAYWSGNHELFSQEM